MRAFNIISGDFLFWTLSSLAGFWAIIFFFLQLVYTFYSISSCVINNDFCTYSFAVERGVRQWDAFSALLNQSINQSKISYLGRKNYVAKMCTNGYHIFVYHSNFFQKFIVWNLNCILYSELFVCWLLHRDTLSLHAWKNNKFGFNRLLSRLLL